ncbi:Zn2-C6 fungal-type DNA-binding domain [Pyrenophora tritici-repentis]|uniref:C6 zinc finger domain protein n=1 Tax=Pyrenophora tritici-repentis TaxID=45151 RepID=A0A5M9LA29_9PLEO|nr:Zn2-C6 fungal-type DNA-binding domain [Pyrenophora tritici-repentis]KAF7450930.1 Zn2-C6 fungal-type DNA-binding domain [Pyrenophora tritici-repentis]KAF7573602.1 C6 zinc finger domain protein [Pyrenophora tritici-repentis]KAI2480836.1 Zn2-C6 fungal-type DNA-binding domain [Pyrenophora tritici-repentis]
MTDRTNEASDKPGARWNLSDQLVNSPDSELPKKPQDQPLNRACEACRISKVRCLMNPDTSSSQCQRCAKANRTCVFAPPAKRRQRKRTDVRVTELEKEIQQMRSLLKTNTTRSSNDVSEHESEDESDDQAHTGEKRKPPSVQSQSAGTTSTYSVFTAPVSTGPMADAAVTGAPTDFFGSSENDIIDRNVVSEDMARELLTIWRNELVTACPGITIPKHWDVLDLRSNKPALFHAIMAAAAHSKGSALSDRLHEETVLLYARSAFIKGEKSVQAIQALIVTVSYYSPSKTPGHLQIYQWVNMAASMALELGLTSKPRTHEQLPKRAIRTLHKISSPEELLEHCRTILLLYIISAGFSMRLKRPNILLFNSWMEECSNILEKSKLLDDKRILAWLKLQRIADEANTAFGFDDASTSFTLSELRMQIILRIFDRRMQDWRKSVPDDVMTLNLELEYHADMLSMWEFGMDGGRYDVIEFRNRYVTLPALDDDCVQPESLLSRSALQINATTKCISAAHAMLDSFIAVPTDKLRKSPNALYVRAVYSLVTLLKADYAVGTDAEMGELFESQNLKVQFYLDTVLKKTKEAAGPQECRNPSHWNFLLEAKLKSWWDEYREWRKEGRDQKRRKTKSGDDSDPTTGNQTPAFVEPTLQMPNFNITNSYPTQPTWNTNELGLDTTTPAQQQPVGDQAAYTHEMGDFSAAFQNGDLYLWNDLTADNFNGWVPQNGPYGGMGFGGMNSQGF